MSSNTSLSKAKQEKNDEFYTKFSDVEAELENYKKHFVGKVIYCNCDDPTMSAFWKYFHLNFEGLGIKELISTHYSIDFNTYAMEYFGGDDENINAGVITELDGNGDFRSPECIRFLKKSDIVVTNPPFSLFREYVGYLMRYEKKFLIVGSKNAVTNRYFFPYLKQNLVWVGMNNISGFVQPSGEIKSFGNVGWYTNLDIPNRHSRIELKKSYSSGYRKYDNYDAIDVPNVSDIPKDYDGIMGVPISFIDKYCPEQFEIVWQASGNTKVCCPKDILSEVLHYKQHEKDRGGCGVIDGKRQYSRIFIQAVKEPL